jgi:hypothetical protein
MALVGTISGSNGTSTTAISGSLIIADSSLANFPSLSSGVKLFVSASKTETGADTPVVVFGGDSFISGALGTDSYFQMKPVDILRIPTNTTASYIYTSGSTNDMYFTQYNGPYTNTTRLRWLESSLGTGLLNGGTLSTANGTTTFSVLSGSGIIVTQNATLTSEPFPTINQVRWSNVVSQSLTYVASNQITYLSINSSGSVSQSPNPPTIAQKESNIYLGRILHQFGSVTNGSITEPAISYGLGESNFNFQRAFGPLKISGHVLAVSQSAGLGTLGITKTAGDSYAEGRNYTLNPNSPNLVLATNDPEIIDCKIFREYTDSSGDPVILTNGGGGYSVIDPTQYNNGGTLAAVNNNEWSNQRVFWYPRSVNRALYVYYGIQKYSTFNEAIDGVSTETFSEGANTAGAAVFVGIITVKSNETTLDAADARITQAPLHRGAGVGGGGGGGSTSPGGSDTYVQFNNASSFGGDSTFTFNSTTKRLTATSGSFYSLTGSSLLASGVNNTGPANFGFSGFTSNFNFTSQSFVGVDTSLSSYTGTLPVISGEYVGRLYNIKDVGGLCATNAFVITASSPNKIDGATELKMSSTSGSISLIAGLSGSSYNWYIMSYT